MKLSIWRKILHQLNKLSRRTSSWIKNSWLIAEWLFNFYRYWSGSAGFSKKVGCKYYLITFGIKLEPKSFSKAKKFNVIFS